MVLIFSGNYNEKYLGETEEEKMTKEERNSFLEAVANFHKLGEMIYSNAKLQEVTKTLKSVMERAEKVTMKESEHWFDNVTVSRHMKQMNEAMKVFEKTAGEMSGLQQRLESAYEDMGSVLNKYYKVNSSLTETDHVKDVDGDGDVDDADSYLTNRNKTISKAVKSEDISISAKDLKKINPSLLKKLSKKMDINIEEDLITDPKTLKKINPNLLRKLAKKMDITIDEVTKRLTNKKLS